MFLHPLALTVLSTFTVFLSAQARLGETERQSIVRYGSAQLPKKQVLPETVHLPGQLHATHNYQGWVIKIVYLNGKVVIQEYSKKTPHPSGQHIQTDELKVILEAEANGGSWKPCLTAPFKNPVNRTLAGAMLGERHWSNGNGSHATLNAMRQSVILYNQEGIEALQKETANKEVGKRKQIPNF